MSWHSLAPGAQPTDRIRRESILSARRCFRLSSEEGPSRALSGLIATPEVVVIDLHTIEEPRVRVLRSFQLPYDAPYLACAEAADPCLIVHRVREERATRALNCAGVTLANRPDHDSVERALQPSPEPADHAIAPSARRIRSHFVAPLFVPISTDRRRRDLDCHQGIRAAVSPRHRLGLTHRCWFAEAIQLGGRFA